MSSTEAQKRAKVKYEQSEKGKAVSARGAAKYGQTEKGKASQARRGAKRREFGFEMINNWFPGAHGHHIDKENVLFIPGELHKSIPHELNNSESMRKMNDVAFEWFYIEEVI